MRKRVTGDLTVNAIAGTSSVFFGFDIAKAHRKDLMGFSILRKNAEEPETKWLRSSKSFASIRPSAANEDYSSKDNPFQAFQWADYTAEPGKTYNYEIYSRHGRAGALSDGAVAKVKVTTEKMAGHPHSVYFNRGAIASQAYTKRFGSVDPDTVGAAAFDWLTRDLLPGLLSFIGRAKTKKHKLYAAIYETQLPVVLNALKKASVDAELELICEGRDGADATAKNETMLADAGLHPPVVIKRTNAKIAHNKFIVLVENNKPKAVWTGSTNVSKNGLFGQLNVGHAVENSGIATDYLAYWQQLKGDPARKDLQDWAEDNDIEPDSSKPVIEDVFSPHRGRDVYKWFVSLASEAKTGLAMTFPFGMSKEFRSLYAMPSEVFRMALLDKYVNGGNKASQQIAIDETDALRKSTKTMLALGNQIRTHSVDGWLKEASGLGLHVNWVHTKFMIIDPLSSSPTTVTGSANWSEPSTNENDENMLIIRKDKRVADIYFTEFMRLFSHHAFRESLKRYLQQHGNVDGWKPQDLKETSKEWLTDHFQDGSQHFNRRTYFST